MSTPLRVMLVIGTRPEAIKMAPLVRLMRTDARFHPIVVSTGQHREMLVPILDWFDITPDHTLDVMEPGQPLARLSGKLLTGLHTLMEAERPDVVMVQGDTTTAFMAALTAYYGYDYFIRQDDPAQGPDGPEATRRHIRVGHIEAGLRTGNLYAPFPEEANRRLITPLAHWHFAPTHTAAQALFDENVTTNVHVTGNTVTDALKLTVARLADHPRPLPHGLPADLFQRRYVLITGHRRENYGEGFAHICEAIRTLATAHPDVAFVYPVHLNRHVQGPVQAQLTGIGNVHLTAPLDYPDFVNLMQHCHLILTDSGGLQEEGPTLGKPVLVMRDITERPEGLMAGTSRVVGTTAARIVENVSLLLTDNAIHARMAQARNPYGDGTAAQQILDLLASAIS